MTMESKTEADVNAVAERLRDAMNRHDLDELVNCFHPDFDSTFPAHPARAFRGHEQMRNNWSRIFATVPNLKSTLVRTGRNQNVSWAEWEWTGTRLDGGLFEMSGVTIQEVRDGSIAWARLYMEPVEERGVGNDQTLTQVLEDPRS